MRHTLLHEWSLPHLDPNVMYQIKMNPHIFNYIAINKPEAKEICFDVICFKKLTPEMFETDRYKDADISLPGIVATNMPNPENKEYRLIDGCHRLTKQLREGRSSGMFYVLDYSFLFRYIEPYGK